MRPLHGHLILLEAISGDKPSHEKMKQITSYLKKKALFGQVVPLKVVASERHVMHAVEHTITAFDEGSNFSKDKSIELLQRLCAERQFDKLLDKLDRIGFQKQNLLAIIGKKGGKKALLEAREFVLKELQAKKAKGLLEASLEENRAALKMFYMVKESEEKSVGLENAIIERVALTSVH